MAFLVLSQLQQPLQIQSRPRNKERRRSGGGAWRKALAWAIYAAVLVLIATVKPLWLDELIQWRVALSRHGDLFRNIAGTPGAVPLGYLFERCFVTAGLTTPLALRSVSIFAGICAVFSVVRLSEYFIPGKGWKAAVILASLPLYIRYATEARPYGPALALSVAGTFLFWRSEGGTTVLRTSIYIAVSVLAMYLQPFSFFVCCSHLFYAASKVKTSRRHFLTTAGSVGLMLLLFLPWYIWARNGWSTAIRVASYRFQSSWRAPLLLVREISGGGYLVSLPLLGFSVLGLWRGRLHGRQRRFLLCLIIVPAALALGADAWSSYFVAIRQFIFILPAVAIAATEGAEVAVSAFPKLQGVLLPLLLASQLTSVFRGLVTANSENWSAAVDTAQRLLPPGGCVLYVPNDAQGLYELANGSLRGRSCQGNDAKAALAIVSPYVTRQDLAGFDKQLTFISKRVTWHLTVAHSTVDVIGTGGVRPRS